jgi:hypothetical protein
MTADFWIAQHIEDLFRNEPRNIGIFVRLNNQIVARFYGEDSDGDVDGRRIRALPYPDVYKQWIDYWRKESAAGGIDPILSSSASNYRVIPGGQVSDIGGDTATDVANYLYSMLVSEGGFQEALATGDHTDATAAVQLSAEVSAALDQAQLLQRDERTDARVAHPVRRGFQLTGRVASYKPAFTQENGRLYIMETIDFTRPKKAAARDHAGWSAYMFQDLKRATRNSEPIAIVKITDADRDLEEVRGGLAVLANESALVNWSDERQRTLFLEERRRIAVGELA